MAALVILGARGADVEAQELAPAAQQDPRTTERAGAPLRLYLSCPNECFESYLRQELSYFDFVRDRYEADRVVLIVRQSAGSGGERFSVALIDQATGVTKIEESFVTSPGSQPEENRALLLQRLLRALYAELEDTPHGAAFRLYLPPRNGELLSELRDPWDYWVFAPELSAEGEIGSAYYWMELTSAVTVRRITERHKFRGKASYSRSLTRYVLESGQDARGDVFGVDGQLIYAYSLADHWGVGGIGTARVNQFENLAGHLRGGPLIEYNLFPYVENARQQLRFAYQVGAWNNWYFEENRQALLQDHKPYHALSVIFDFNQPWGSVQWVIQGNSFLDDPRLYRLSSGAIFSLQLVRGLALFFEGKAAYLQDQINLRRRPLTDLELLLETAQIPTEFTTEFALGLSYTWGSIHNTIVNPRFGRVDVEEE